MTDKNKMYKVKNRSASRVVYSINELGVRREFAPTETKSISFEELEKLTYQTGGREILTNFLQVIGEDALDSLGVIREIEYNMSEEQIVDLMKNGSLDAFLDCLDFAPVGIIDLIKMFAVQLPLNDSEKREALFNKTGFDVTKALAHIKAEQEESQQPKEEKRKRRVVTTTTPEEETPKRRVITTKE